MIKEFASKLKAFCSAKRLLVVIVSKLKAFCSTMEPRPKLFDCQIVKELISLIIPLSAEELQKGGC